MTSKDISEKELIANNCYLDAFLPIISLLKAKTNLNKACNCLQYQLVTILSCIDRFHWKVIKLVALIIEVCVTNIFSVVITSKPELITFQ